MLTKETLSDNLITMDATYVKEENVHKDVESYCSKLKNTIKDIKIQIKNEKERFRDYYEFQASGHEIHQHDTLMKFLIGQRIAFEYALLILKEN